MFGGREILTYIIIPVVLAWVFARWYVIWAETHCEICNHHWNEHFEAGFDGCPVRITWAQRCRCLAKRHVSAQTWLQMIGHWMLLLRRRPALTEKES